MDNGNGHPAASRASRRPESPFPDDTNNLRELFRACLAEFLGMTMFVFIGCGSVAATGEFLVDDRDFEVKVNVARVLPIATAFGLAITVLAFNIGPISGGHMNPAVTYALMLQRKVSPPRMVMYFLAQFTGSMLGSAILWLGISGATWNLSPGVNITDFQPGIDPVPAVGRPPFYLGANQVSPVLSTSNALLLEIMGTSFLIGTVMATTVDRRTMGSAGSLAPIPIGISIWIAHLVLIPWTGCGINPARTFGPAIIDSIAGVDTWGDSGLVVYYMGPFLGATLTVGCMHLLWGSTKPPKVQAQQGDELEAAA